MQGIVLMCEQGSLGQTGAGGGLFCQRATSGLAKGALLFEGSASFPRADLAFFCRLHKDDKPVAPF
jgi:hypothetical protein